MSDAAPQSPTLDDLMTVNEELTALVEAGVPLELDVGRTGTNLETTYARFSATLGRRMSNGRSLESALGESGDDIPSTYRSLMLLGLRFDQMELALDSSRELASVSDDSRFVIRAGLVYPLILACLAYAGIIAFLWRLVPLLASAYDVPGMQQGSWISALVALRTGLPFLIAIPPALLTLLVVLRLWRSRDKQRQATRLTDPLRMSNRLRYAQFAEICAELLQSGVSKNEAIDLAAGVCGSAQSSEARSSAAGSPVVENTPGKRAALIATFPPLLALALTGTPTDADCSLALQAAAVAYRRSTMERTDRFRRLLPLLLVVFVGGGIVLLYGLTLFMPLVELLEALSR